MAGVFLQIKVHCDCAAQKFIYCAALFCLCPESWWEVVDSQTGKLLYRRILAHSHVNEQPFTRSGGPVPIQPGQPIVIRAHMGGIQSHYGGQVLSGSVDGGFKPVADSLPSLETVEPLPTGCAF